MVHFLWVVKTIKMHLLNECSLLRCCVLSACNLSIIVLLLSKYKRWASYFWGACTHTQRHTQLPVLVGVRWPSVWGRGNHSRPWKVKCDAAGPLGCVSESQLHNELAELGSIKDAAPRYLFSTHAGQSHSVTCAGGVEGGGGTESFLPPCPTHTRTSSHALNCLLPITRTCYADVRALTLLLSLYLI